MSFTRYVVVAISTLPTHFFFNNETADKMFIVICDPDDDICYIDFAVNSS